MSNITKKELVSRIASQNHDTQRTVKTIVNVFLEEIIIELAKDNRIEFRDFGVFAVKSYDARVAFNPKTMEKLHVSPKRKVKFRAGKLLKTKINSHLKTDEEQVDSSPA